MTDILHLPDTLTCTVGLLIVDRDEGAYQLYHDYFSAYPWYEVRCVPLASHAKCCLTSDKRYHCCITELGIDDYNGDEFYLLKRFAPFVPFLVLSSRNSLEKGFALNNHGALAIEPKPVKQPERLVSLLNNLFLTCILTPGVTRSESSFIAHFIEVFQRHLPSDAKQWAEHSGLPLPVLRRHWERNFSVDPDDVVRVHQVYANAMRQTINSPDAYSGKQTSQFPADNHNTPFFPTSEEQFLSALHRVESAVHTALQR